MFIIKAFAYASNATTTLLLTIPVSSDDFLHNIYRFVLDCLTDPPAWRFATRATPSPETHYWTPKTWNPNKLPSWQLLTEPIATSFLADNAIPLSEDVYRSAYATLSRIREYLSTRHNQSATDLTKWVQSQLSKGRTYS